MLRVLQTYAAKLICPCCIYYLNFFGSYKLKVLKLICTLLNRMTPFFCNSGGLEENF